MHTVTRIVTIVCAPLVFLLSFGQARAATRHVPADYGTIQAALDATNAWDTVLVAPGTFDEFLVGPEHSFVLSCWYPPDSSAELRTVLDPIAPVEADTPSVFVVRADTAVIQNLAFFNRPELRQPEWYTRQGGVRSTANLLVVDHCQFDSVSSPIACIGDVDVLDAEFQGCLHPCIQTTFPNRVNASRCRFESGAYSLVTGYDGSQITDCVFECNTLAGYFLQLGGTDILVAGCRFGPCTTAFPVLDITPNENVIIENCEFVGLNGAMHILQAGIDCATVGNSPLIIRYNTFSENYQNVPASGVVAVNLQCTGTTSGMLGELNYNEFRDGSAGGGALSPGVLAYGSLTLRSNVFERLAPEELPDVSGQRNSLDTIVAIYNHLVPPGLAAQTDAPHFDARWNWWGDSSGPYNASENPEGLGSEVGWGVEFFPWLLSPEDTTVDTNEVAADELDILIPAKFELRAFPNPFNAATTLEIAVARAGDYEVVLYDVTGREAARVFSGRIETRASARVDANKLASGVYFARLCDAHDAFATVKLLILK